MAEGQRQRTFLEDEGERQMKITVIGAANRVRETRWHWPRANRHEQKQCRPDYRRDRSRLSLPVQVAAHLAAGQSQRYHHTRIGVGGRMDTLQCAVVLAKLERFEWELAQRHALGARYAALLADVPGVRLLAVRSDRDCVWAQYTVFVPQRAQIQAALKDLGIPTAVHYPKPLHLQPAYAHLCCPECCPHSVQAGEVVMSLPMSADLTFDDQRRVIDGFVLALREFAPQA
jgi:dTDP-4-amino-4,6-dideoxygalactose transaminase